MNALYRMVVKGLRDTADKIEAGNCELTESEAMDIMSAVAHHSMSKDSACGYLNHMSRSRFDELVREGKIPKGRKVRGYKELRWYQDELDAYKMRETRGKQTPYKRFDAVN